MEVLPGSKPEKAMMRCKNQGPNRAEWNNVLVVYPYGAFRALRSPRHSFHAGVSGIEMGLGRSTF